MACGKKVILLTVLISSIGCLCTTTCASDPLVEYGEIRVLNVNKYEKITYHLYIPGVDRGSPVPLLVCIGGLNSSGEEFIAKRWRQFADDNDFAILSLGFKFDPTDWDKERSYQYPKAWSGKALIEILEIIAKKAKIDKEGLYMFGISAGAQFAHRFALMRPDLCKAVAAHAAGGYDKPTREIPTKFLLTVGALDDKDVSRVGFAKIFILECHKHNIDAQLIIISGIAHRHTVGQNEMSRQFFLKVRGSLK